MFGDILSDEIAGLIGAPGGNIGDRTRAASKSPLQDPNTGAADLGDSANTQQ